MKTQRKNSGFTLIELLTVIAIIGILAGIIIPTVTAVRISANKAKSKVQFNQWGTSMGLFKQEYGYYPRIDGGSGNILSTNAHAKNFLGALTARDLTGAKLAAGASDLCGNTKLLSFYSVASSDFDSETNPQLIVDAFGNKEIGILYDKNGDGQLTAADGSTPTVKGVEDQISLTPDISLSGASAPRQGVIFYSAGRGRSTADIVYSWK